MGGVTTEHARKGFSIDVPILYLLVFLVPLLVLPGFIDNAFNTPKTALLLLGVSVMLGIYVIGFLRGTQIKIMNTMTPWMLCLIVILNLFNLLYTQNNYFTIVSVALNIACLLFFYFISLNANRDRIFILIIISVLSGVFVSIITYSQFFGHFILFKWAHKGIMVMGTIGNSNYLGAYLVFPLFAALGLVFLLKGKWKWLPVPLILFILGAFLFSRARAGWFGFFLSIPLFSLLLLRIHRFSPLLYARTNPKRMATGALLLIVVLVTLWYAAPDRLHTMMQFGNVTRSDTLRLRIKKYYAASWWLFKQSPLYGTGLWSFRNRVYWAQAALNEKDPTYFKDYPEPKPRRVHTEYLEILNDGGLVAGAVLSLFFLMVMRHGWQVIRNDNIPVRDRTIAATAFSSVTAIMLTSIFFFCFRINSTLFMTVLMLGILEGLYVCNHDLIKSRAGWRGPGGRVLIPVVILLLIGFVWFAAIRPFKGEREHHLYKTALPSGNPQEAEKHLLKAIEYDPHNTAYCLYAAQLYMNVIPDLPKANEYIERAIVDFNGDITRWSLFFFKGLLKFQSGSLFEARAAFEKALYFNPEFQPAHQKLAEVNQVIKNHDRVMIKFR